MSGDDTPRRPSGNATSRIPGRRQRHALRPSRTAPPSLQPSSDEPAAGWSLLNPALLQASGRRQLTRRLAWEWGLVFEARNLPYRLEHGFSGYRFYGPSEDAERMAEEIALYERENVERPRLAPPMEENTALTIGFLLLLALFHGISRNTWRLFGYDSAANPIPWVERGVCNCFEVDILGQWWRTVTALTLHADVSHLFGNLMFGGLVMVLLCRELGSGAGWLTALLTGLVGNTLNCALQGTSHVSLGASTSVFGAIAVLCTLRAVRDQSLDRRSLIAPVGAGVMLLGFLGMGGGDPFQQAPTDVGAHVLGFAAGIPIGAAAGWLVRRHGPPHGKLSMLPGGLAALLVVGSWILAFS